MSDHTANICKRCLLRELSEADRLNITTYQDAIQKRLAICKDCELLNAGTCNGCGCYVELRALSKTGKCPRKKW